MSANRVPEKSWKNSNSESPHRYAPWLWFLLVLFCLRVGGQMLVAFSDVSWLPPMEEWYSGLIPYRWLLPTQFLIILVFGKVCIDFTRGAGFFVVPRRVFGSGLLIFGSLYFGAMVIRYVIRMGLYPDERWFGGTIPIIFHSVLATFILLVGHYHWAHSRRAEEKFSELVRPLPRWHPKAIYYATLKGLMKTVGQLSDGIRLGSQYGFDSGVMLEYVYQNKASGKGWLERVLDRMYLNSPGWRGIRERAEILKDVLRKTIHENHRRGMSTVLLDVACGGGRYVLEVFQEFPEETVTAVLRDYKEENVQKARHLARDLGVSAFIESGDAFSDRDLNRVTPRPNVIVVSGLHEIFPDNELIRNHFRQLYRILQAPGTLIFTIQPYHPQIELIARLLTSHSGGPWVMRLRPSELTRQWAEEAGFRCAQMQMDSQHIFGVVTAHKTPKAREP